MSTPIPTASKPITPDIASMFISLTRSLYKTVRSVSPTCSFLEMKTLNIVYDSKRPSMKYIADELGISSPALTSVIEGLVKDKAVTRTEDENDRRMIRITLTPEGKKIFEKNRDTIYEAFRQRVSVLTEDERNELSRILEKLQD